MIQLEQTIIARARDHLSAVRAFYTKIKAGTTDDDAQDDYRRDHAALYALLEFGHLRDSGMSAEGRTALLAVEDDAAAALRNHCASTSPGLNVEVRGQNGRTENVDVSKAEHSLVLGAFSPKQN